jgi:hypothetical protein
MRAPAVAGLRRELIAIGLVLVVVLPLGAIYLQSRSDGEWYQSYFTPAAMLACGQGFVDVPVEARPPELTRFLDQETRTVDCATLEGLPTLEVADFHISMRWLFTATAGVWWLAGQPSWGVMEPLMLFLLALCAVGAYGLLRLVARRAVATPLAAVAVLWPWHLLMLPQLRDYSKAPFLWLGCLGLAVGALGSTLRTRLIAAALGGAAVGVGLGWRSDVLVLVPVGVVVLLLQPWEGRRRLWTGPAAVAAFLAAFALTGAPILSAYGGENNGGIVAIEGLAGPSGDQIGLRSDLYRTSYLYNDVYTIGLVAAHSRLVEHEPGRGLPNTPEAAEDADTVYREQAEFLPADTMLRAALAGIASLRLGAPGPLGGLVLGLPILFAVLVLLGARRPRALAVVLLLVVPVAGVTALQWNLRHAFHVALAGILVFAALIELGLRLRERRFQWPTRRALGLTAGFLAATVVLGLGGYAVLRAAQDARVDDYLAQLERQPRSPATSEAEARGEVTVLPLPASWVRTWDGAGEERSAMLRVEAAGCGSPSGTLTLRYTADQPIYDLTQQVSVEPRSGAVWYVVAPVFAPGRPTAVELAGAPGCTLDVERVRPRDLPLLLNVLLDGRTRADPGYATADTRLLLLGRSPGALLDDF